MAKTNEPETRREKVQPIDWRVPLFITVRQTDTRNVYEAVIGDAKAADFGLANVEAYAKAEALKLKTTVAVFGPQVVAFEPPPPAEPAQVAFGFGKAETPETE